MAGHGHWFPLLRELPDPRPKHDGPGKSRHAAHHMHHGRAGKIHVPVTQAEVGAELRQPSATPNPVGEYRIHQHRHEETENHEGGKLPPLRHRARWDGCGRIHEHHLKQEEREDTHVIGVPAQKETLEPKQAERLSKERHRELMVQTGCAPKRSHRAHAPHLKSIAADPVTQHAYAIDHEVHAHRMRHVLRARKTGLYQGEPRLHEHHEEAREQRPHDIDGNLIVTYGVHHFAQRRICGILDCDVFGGTRGRSGGIADRSLHLCLFRGILLLCPTGRR